MQSWWLVFFVVVVWVLLAAQMVVGSVDHSIIVSMIWCPNCIRKTMEKYCKKVKGVISHLHVSAITFCYGRLDNAVVCRE